MTPCEKLGYKVGDKFTCLGGEEFEDGTELRLVKDDKREVSRISDQAFKILGQIRSE